MNLGKVAVVGAGQMGTGIAYVFAVAGYTTHLVDIRPEAVRKSIDSISQIIADGIRRGKLSESDGDKVLARVHAADNVAMAATGAELLIETVAEILPAKIDIVTAAERALPADALIATNTSSLSVTEIGAALQNPARLVGMHFFNPVYKMKLVELVRGLSTSNESVDKAREYTAALSMTSIVVNESPGLTTSRMSALLGNEAMYMLMEGTSSAEDIDTALRLGFNHPMGPLELGDLTGWDTRLAVLQYLHQTLGEKFRPCPLIAKMVKAGRTGRKASHGVYEYRDGKAIPGSGLKVGGL